VGWTAWYRTRNSQQVLMSCLNTHRPASTRSRNPKSAKSPADFGKPPSRLFFGPTDTQVFLHDHHFRILCCCSNARLQLQGIRQADWKQSRTEADCDWRCGSGSLGGRPLDVQLGFCDVDRILFLGLLFKSNIFRKLFLGRFELRGLSGSCDRFDLEVAGWRERNIEHREHLWPLLQQSGQ
jgi:hypothetical protein